MAVLPSDLRHLSSYVTAGPANVLSAGMLVAAPGFGLRLRLWRFQAATADTTQAPTKWRAQVADQAETDQLGTVAQPGFGFGELNWPGGLALSENESVHWRVQSAVAGTNLQLGVEYTVEATA